jgi:hypothetical protein
MTPPTLSPNPPAAVPDPQSRDGGLRLEPSTARDIGVSLPEPAKKDVAGLVRDLTSATTKDIDNLISNLQSLKKHLQAEGERVHADVLEYAKLTQTAVTGTQSFAQTVARWRDERGLR